MRRDFNWLTANFESAIEKFCNLNWFWYNACEVKKMTLTIEIAEVKQKSLEKIAAEKGKKINELVTEIVNEYLNRDIAETKETNYLCESRVENGTPSILAAMSAIARKKRRLTEPLKTKIRVIEHFLDCSRNLAAKMDGVPCKPLTFLFSINFIFYS